MSDSDSDKPPKAVKGTGAVGYGLNKFKSKENGVFIKNYKQFKDENLASQDKSKNIIAKIHDQIGDMFGKNKKTLNKLNVSSQN